MIKEILAKTALHYHEKTLPTNWDLNIYRGCEHCCEYCFAKYSHKYLKDTKREGFFNDIYVKTNIAEILDKELNKKSWKGDSIQISGVTDCYQPIEEKYKIMREVLKVLIKHKQSAHILTKSTLILRDYDLIEQLTKVAYVSIGATVTTLNEEKRIKIEPNTFSSIERLEALKEFTKLNCHTTVMLMPIIPYLTDNIKELEEIYKITSEYKINNIIPAPLNMMGSLKTEFYNFLKINYPTTYEKIQHLYKSAYVSKEYEVKLSKFLNSMRKKYKIYSFNKKIVVPKIVLAENKQNGNQLDLFI